MEVLILLFFTNLPTIFFACFLIAFLIPILSKRKHNSQKEIIINKKTIITNSISITRLCVIPFLFVFGFIGIIMCFFVTSDILANLITAKIFGAVLILIPLIFTFNTLKTIYKIINGKYVILVDTLEEKEIVYDRDDGNDYYLYFKDYFKTYNQKVYTTSSIYRSSRKKSEFYLLFLYKDNDPIVFNKKKYILRDIDKQKIIKMEELKNYCDIKEFSYDDENQATLTEVNPKQIIKDFYNKEQKKTIALNIFICLFIIALIITGILWNYMFAIVGLIFLAFFGFMTIIKIHYICSTINKIKRNEYKIKEDVVTSLNERISFSESNDMISFRFENYTSLFYEDKKKFYDAKVGDKFYLVFVKGEDEPIKIYDAKKHYLNGVNLE